MDRSFDRQPSSTPSAELSEAQRAAVHNSTAGPRGVPDLSGTPSTSVDPSVAAPAAKGGHGEVSLDEESRRLEANVREATQAVYKRLATDYPELKWQPKLSVDNIQAQYVQRGLDPNKVKDLPISGAAPDGGCFFIDGKLALCSEAKKQQDGGNAIERWHKNHAMVQPFGREVAYVTFCSGPGAGDEAVMSKILNPAMHNEDIARLDRGEPPMNKQWNVPYNEGLSCYRSVNGFEQTQVENSLETILRAKLDTAREQALHPPESTLHAHPPALDAGPAREVCPVCGR